MGVLAGLLGRRYESISAEQAHQAVDEGALMIDVRSSREWNAGHAPLARHVPMDQLENRLGRVPQDRRVVVVCRSGSRSRSVCRRLSSMGYDVVNLSGGLSSWARHGFPVVDSRGRKGAVA